MVSNSVDSSKSTGEREVKLRINGMFCKSVEVWLTCFLGLRVMLFIHSTCSDSINDLLRSLQSTSDITSFTPLTHANPFTTLTYTPRPPSGFTLRKLNASISSLGPFAIYPIRASDVLTTLARAAQARESRSILVRLVTAFAFAIPTFVIAIVAMSLLPSSHPLAHYFSTPVWGNASRATVALFVLATPVQFGVGSLFYVRAWKSLRGVWKRGGQGRWKSRLLRWGSMDSLVAIGTSAGFFSSVVYMVIDIKAGSGVGRTPDGTDGSGPMRGGTMGFFDSS